jgi:hypothetical protein
MTLMSPLLLLPYYIHWHYSQGLTDLVGLIKNAIWFFWHFFSVPDLFKTLFQPWQRLHEETKPGSGMGDLMTVWLINVLMIMAGALIRLTFIAFAFIFIGVSLVMGAAAFIIWFALPLAIIIFFIIGVLFVLKSL